MLLLGCTAQVGTVPLDPPAAEATLLQIRLSPDEDPDDDPWSRDWIPTTIEVDDWSGQGGIHVRGNSTRDYDKKSYALETWDAAGEDLDVELAGLPAEEDWVLQGPYSDKTLLRNHLMYQWSRNIGFYAARTRLAQLSVHGEARGVYVLMEKLKRDDNRIVIPAGGALLKRDWVEEEPLVTAICEDELLLDWPSDPAGIVDRLSAVEAELLDGELSRVNLESFVDYMLLVELGRNVDAYVLSTRVILGADDTLAMGPIWDFNGALGNADYFRAWETEGWHYDYRHFPEDNPNGFCWYEALLETPEFRELRRSRWADHRAGAWSDAALTADIDAAVEALGPAAEANFEVWPVLGEYVWPNDEGAEERTTYVEEVDYLKHWVLARAAWIDQELG